MTLTTDAYNQLLILDVCIENLVQQLDHPTCEVEPEYVDAVLVASHNVKETIGQADILDSAQLCLAESMKQGTQTTVEKNA